MSDELKAGLANVRASMQKAERGALADAALAKLGGGLADVARDIIRRGGLPPELQDRLVREVTNAARPGRGRPTKGVALSVAEALTAAAVDDLMDAQPGLTLDEACQRAAKSTHKRLAWKQLRTLRANIMRAYAPREAADCYQFRRGRFNPSTQDPPAPMSLDDVKAIWAALGS
ncbi:hypothetical protein [Mesorhizobium sp. M1136]|uniref:hypothetical protein n=1 Tax=Mesorhizobium sp. M1136 TaxID=2957059 RepID=UPI003335234A